MAYRWMQAAALALALAAGGPALAQSPYDAGGFGDPFDPGEGGYDWREEEAAMRRDGWRGRGGPGGGICVTSRGNCVVAPAPANAPCRCMIPGFGWKRGGVVE